VVEGAATRTRLSDAAGVSQGRGVAAAAWGKTRWRLGPVVRWEQYAPFDRVKGNDRQRVTLGAYWDLAEAARLVLNYDLDLSDAPARTGDAAALQAQVTF
jgi:hypothetical protein